MIANTITQYLPLVIFMTVIGLINYAISVRLAKKKLTWIWIIPGLFVIPSAIFLILGFLSEGWGVLGYLLYGFIFLAATIGAAISSFIIYYKNKQQNT